MDDHKIHLDILNELNWDRRIGDLSHLTVTVKNGTVTVGGRLAHYVDQQLIVDTVQQIAGVRHVVQEWC